MKPTHTQGVKLWKDFRNVCQVARRVAFLGIREKKNIGNEPVKLSAVKQVIHLKKDKKQQQPSRLLKLTFKHGSLKIDLNNLISSTIYERISLIP